MSRTDILVKPRIEAVDALRGFALMGLCLIHGLEHFDLLIYPETAPRLLQVVDPVAHGAIFFLFAGKAYAIFSFMFGLSFFIQMDRQADRGVDFRWRFLWRLALLAVIGYLHGLVYCGDVLVIFALLGFCLVVLDRLGSWALLVVSALLLLNLPTLVKLVTVLGDTTLEPRPLALWELYGRAFGIYAQNSLAQVILLNAWLGQKMKWGWYLQEGRLWQILGLFLWGMWMGRSRFFEQLEARRTLSRRFFTVAATLFVPLFILRLSLPRFHLDEGAAYLAEKLVASYSNLAFTVLLISGFVLLWGSAGWRRRLRVLAPYGRMSLTNYVAQSLVGVPFFYGFGLAMYRQLGHTLSLLFAIALIALMIWASRAWLRRFYYGPLEWVWRTATLMSADVPFRRR